MAEPVLKPIRLGDGYDRNGRSHVIQDRLQRPRLGVKLIMKPEVKQGELELSHHLHAGLIVPRSLHFI